MDRALKKTRHIEISRWVVAAAFALAACGKQPDAPADAAVTVKIAHAGPLTGGIAHQGKDDENGVRLAIDQANEKKIRIGGKLIRFEMLSEDDQGDPKIGTVVAQKVVDANVAAVCHLSA